MTAAALAVAGVVGTALAADPGASCVAALGSAEATVWTVDEQAAPQALESGEPLTEGAVLKTDGVARLIWVDGRRFETVAGSVVEIAADGPRVRSGSVTELEPVPAVAGLEPLLRARAERRRAAAARIRSPADDLHGIQGLEPGGGGWVSPAAVVLEFEPVTGAESYRVEVETDRGELVWSGETVEPRVALPEGVLEPDRGYFWRVAAQPRSVWRFGEALFFTADTRTLEVLQAFDGADQPEDLRSLAEALLASLERRDGREPAAGPPPSSSP